MLNSGRPGLRGAALRTPPAPASALKPHARPEPDYEVVEFPTEQYVNAKLQPPPPPPPRPPGGTTPVEPCGLCGGGGARVLCAECGRRALCASCDEMYHRHPKRRHHVRQTLARTQPQQAQDVRPPLPPKSTPPVPPPRKHKTNAEKTGKPQIFKSSNPIDAILGRRATLGSVAPISPETATLPNFQRQMNHVNQTPAVRFQQPPAHLGSLPYLAGSQNPMAQSRPGQTSTLMHPSNWNRMRPTNPVPHMTHNVGWPAGSWEMPENCMPPNIWEGQLRRGASVLELGAGNMGSCAGCAHCYRYGSHTSLERPWHTPWPTPPCCSHPPHHHPHSTSQPYRRESRTMSRAGSRAASPALSVRSRASRRVKPRTPSPSIPSSDADSESECDPVPEKHIAVQQSQQAKHTQQAQQTHHIQNVVKEEIEEDSLGPPPPAPSSSWECEHCTFVNESGVRVCVVCCKTPTSTPQVLSNLTEDIARITMSEQTPKSHNGETTNQRKSQTLINSDTSPPRDQNIRRPSIQHNVNDTRSGTPHKETHINNQTTCEQNYFNINTQTQLKHSIPVGPSPPREVHKQNQNSIKHNASVGPSPPREIVRKATPNESKKHNASVGTSPSRDTTRHNSVGSTKHNVSVGPSLPRDINRNTPARQSPTRESSHHKATVKRTTSSTGTSPPPQSISTQTYEVPSQTWERAPSACRSRSRRRFRDEARRERSHSRLSMSSDTRESERSVRTTGRWEWRENRDSSPGASDEERRRPTLTRRASHLDLRRTRPIRRTSLYGSAAVSPEPLTSARSLEVLAGMGARREAERGLELARLLGDAERMGFNATEVHAALAQSPGAPLAWLRERWPSLCSGVRAAAARLAPGINVTETEARTALAKHRGALWPAVTECVERFRHQIVSLVGEEGRLRGHVWGSPAGVEVEAAPPSIRRSHRSRAAESSDEFEFEPTSPVKMNKEDYLYMPETLDKKYTKHGYDANTENINNKTNNNEDIAKKLKELLIQAGVPAINENLLIKGLLNTRKSTLPKDISKRDELEAVENRYNTLDLGQSENDFIDAYNQLTRLSPLPNVKTPNNSTFSTNQVLEPAIEYTTTPAEVAKKSVSEHQNMSTKKPVIYNYPLDSDSSPSLSRRKLTSKKNKKETKVNNEKNKTQHDNKIPNKSNTVSKTNLENNVTTLQDDKANNLNDIVDNTQRIIQQMKDEINSDINSLEGNDISASESDNSSDEPDVTSDESSYDESQSEEESQEHSHNEKETESESEDSQPKETGPQEKMLLNNRTSSEDNEQFEEAIDHLEGEVVDEIKQSNMEKLDSIVRNLQEEHIVAVQINSPSERNVNIIQDFNNNFATVQSFEEIYEELSSHGAISQPQINKTLVIETQKNKVGNAEIYAKHKHEIAMINFIPANPQEITIQHTDYRVLNALLDYSNELITNEENIQDMSENIENIHDPNQVDDITILPIEKQNIFITSAIDRASSSSSDSTSNADSDRTEILNHGFESVVIMDTGNHNEHLLRTQPITTIEISDDRTTEIIEIETHEIHKRDEEVNSGKLTTKTSNNQKIMKSNIPKLVKTTTNVQTFNKATNKQTGSKVPVRRTSLKQYPAPSPPKTHFGNIHSGHVKQLQTRLFNKQSVSSEPPKAETSTAGTLTKTKKQAPQPPITNTHKLSTPPRTSPPKKPYFRETCGTEDEWTESDDDLPVRSSPKQVTESLPPSSSPPPPITVRRVSGQIIDLANVKLPEGSPERQVRMILAEGAAETWEQAQLAVELVARGTETPTALLAALECLDLPSALTYLNQECELCASKLPEHEMVSMLRCTHRCCRECACVYFTVQITERSIVDCVCPFCKAPELDALADDTELEYFAHLDILLKTLLTVDVHELFQRKLRDRTLARDPNFRWCVECSSGFFVHPKQKRLRCPECRSLTCASCRKPWVPQHEGLTCEEFTLWQEDNDPERSVAAVNQHLKENGLECPRCHFKYSLSRGGCMHFTCTQCKYEFCYGCGKPFMMGARCGLSEYCAKLGLHAHHPRNCLFYLRDKEPHELQTLLQMNNVAYETELVDSTGSNRCPVQLQRETPTGLVDGACNAEVANGHAGLCKIHYVEYLAKLSRGLDPIPIMDVMDLVAELRRRALPLPERGPWDTDPIYAGMCAEIVKEKIPLD